MKGRANMDLQRIRADRILRGGRPDPRPELVAREAAASARLADDPIWVWYRRPRGKRAHAFNDREGAHNGATVAACRRYLTKHTVKLDGDRPTPKIDLCPGCLDVVKGPRADDRTQRNS